MRKGFRAVWIGLLVVTTASAWVTAAVWVADFTPSTFNPAVGDVVSFAVCESCLGNGAYTYIWDFNNDGAVDAETPSTLAACTYSEAGYHAVKLTVRDAGGREQTRTKGIWVGTIPAYGVRNVIVEDDGAVFVSIALVVNSTSTAPAVVESVPAGWQLEVVDAAGAMWQMDSETRQLKAVWMSQAQPGDEIVFTYRLYSNYASQSKQLSGEVSEYVAGVRYTAPVCGELAVP